MYLLDSYHRRPSKPQGAARRLSRAVRSLFSAVTTAADFLLYEHVQLCRCHCPELDERCETLLRRLRAVARGRRLPQVRLPRRGAH